MSATADTTSDSSTATDAVFDAGETIAHGAVHLDVTDLPRALDFWRDVVGLTQLGEVADGAVRLGAGGRILIVLHAGAEHGPRRGYSGLYHVAIHMADEGDLARVIARLAEVRWPQSPTDHTFSKSTYLSDPDGIGIEIALETLDRYSEVLVQGGEFGVIDSAGRRRGVSEPLDVEAVLSQLDDRGTRPPLAAGTTIGHLHLHVADLAETYSFYRDQLGLTEHVFMMRGMADLGTGGPFPHRLALNVWQGEGAPQPPAGTAGLRHFTLVARDADELAAIKERLATAGTATEIANDDLLVRDPAGNRIRLSALPASPA